jgi:hypothetical protein
MPRMGPEGGRDANDLVELPPGVKRLKPREDSGKPSRRTLSDALRDAERARLGRSGDVTSNPQR